MKNCGRRFHNEVGKYRFLNELIKVVSPKVSSLQIGSCLTWMKRVPDCHLLFPVHGWHCTWEGEAEDRGDVVQLDGGFPKRSQDQWSLPDAEKTGCVEIIDIMHVNRRGSSLIQCSLSSPGLVTHDPELPLDRTLIPSPPTRPKHPVFDNEDMGKVRDWSFVMLLL